MFKTQSHCPTCGRPEKRPTRSINQNKYMWGVVYHYLSDYTGYTLDEIHELMKHKFLPRTLDLQDERFTVGNSTTELDIKEMGDYLKQIREWALTLKPPCRIPEPNEIIEDNSL